MDTDKYEKMLYKLFLKGMIDEETLEEKMMERKNKQFEENVNKAILELKDEGQLKKEE
jgi:hypothetical protein